MATMIQVMDARKRIWALLEETIKMYHDACDKKQGWLARASHDRIGQLENAHECLDRRIYDATPASGKEACDG